ncbi:MAG: hypothetical protein WDO56_24900 [Gammaproteobacteria bacterium]
MHDLPANALPDAAFRAPNAAAPASAHVSRHSGHRFYVGMACTFALLAIAGFTPTYWSKVVAGTFGRAPIFHIHGLLVFAWTAFYLAQTSLVAAGRTPSHRSWGMAGIALFSVMICSTAALTIRSMQVGESLGAGEAVRQITVATFVSIGLMAGLFAAAIATVRRPETHKRLMVLVMVVLVQAAVARLPLLFVSAGPGGPPSLSATLYIGLVTDILILAAMAYDWRTRGRPHGAYVWGGLLILTVQVLVVPLFGSSAAGMSFAKALEGIMG